MDPKRNSQCSDMGEAEGGGLKLRETGLRSPTTSLPSSARCKSPPQVMTFQYHHGHMGNAEATLRQIGPRKEGDDV